MRFYPKKITVLFWLLTRESTRESTTVEESDLNLDKELP